MDDLVDTLRSSVFLLIIQLYLWMEGNAECFGRKSDPPVPGDVGIGG